MRLFFPNHEHDSVLMAPGDSSLGSASDNTIVLRGEGVSAYHANLTIDARGYVLTVLDPGAHVHVNARRVREKALLRLGDLVSLGLLQFLLKPDSDAEIQTYLPPVTSEITSLSSVTDEHDIPIKVVLRGVSGACFGKIVPVKKRLSIGRDSNCGWQIDDPAVSSRHALIEQIGNQIFLHEGESNSDIYVNGVKVKKAVLYCGDQLMFGHQRFVLEAPGWPTREQSERLGAKVTPAISLPTLNEMQNKKPTPLSMTNRSIWWLIGAALLVGLLMSWLLTRGF